MYYDIGENMITTIEVLAKTKITYPQLNRLKELGILPRPKLIGQGRRRGVIGTYEDNVVEIISRVKYLKRRKVSLCKIADIIKSELAEIKTFKPGEEYLIPIGSDELQSYLSVYKGFHDWINVQIKKQKPGYEFYSVEMGKVIREGAEYLNPKEIKVKPKSTKEA